MDQCTFGAVDPSKGGRYLPTPFPFSDQKGAFGVDIHSMMTSYQQYGIPQLVRTAPKVHWSM